MTDPPNDAPRTGDAVAPANVSAPRRRKAQPHHRPAATDLSAASDAMANLASAIRQLVQTEVAAQVAAALAERPAVAELLTVKQAAAAAQVAPATIRRWIRTGHLNARHAGRAVRIKRVDLERFLSSNHRVAGDLTPEQCAARDFG